MNGLFKAFAVGHSEIRTDGPRTESTEEPSINYTLGELGKMYTTAVMHYGKMYRPTTAVMHYEF